MGAHEIMFEFMKEFIWIGYSLGAVASVMLVVYWLGKQVD
jgi:hypothetical protein